MQKIFSTRIEEVALHEMEQAVRKLGISKRQFVEEAIRLRAQQPDAHDGQDVWERTRGAWKRDEPVEETIAHIRRAFEKSFKRHFRGKNARLLR